MRKILQRLLSKLFIVSTIIIIQMIWWFFLFYTASVASRVFQDLLYVAAILLSLYIVNRRMKMYIKMSWIFLILSVPIVGIPCYFFFGRPELTSKTQKRMARIVEAYAPLRPENELLNETLRLTDMDAYRQSRLITQNQKYPLYAEDCTEYFKSGEEAFESILKDLRSAEKFIFMEYFIIGSGVMLDQILYILKEKVKHGVVVRIIYDDFGSINAIPPHFIKEMESIGIQTRRFNPYKPMLSVIMNDRDHRKILVIDGRVAHTGGYNIADEYINKKIRFGYWKDAGIRVEGECVNSFTTMFLEMWNYINKDNAVPISFPILPDIYLQEIRMEEAAAIYHAIDTHRDYLRTWLPFVDNMRTTADEEAFLRQVLSAPAERNEPIFGIWNQQHEICGLIGFHFSDFDNHRTELGYWLLPEYQHRGIITESVRKLCLWAVQEKEIKRIQIRCAVGNAASNAVPVRLGFIHEGTERCGELLASGEYTDIHIYSILKEEVLANLKR